MFSQILDKPSFMNNQKSKRGSEKWLTRLDKIIEPNPGDPSLNNIKIAEELSVSERDLFRKVKKLSGLSPQKYIRRFRLRQAKKYLMKGKYKTVNETADAVGYSNVSYFIKQFEIEFGVKPLHILQENGWR